MTADFRFTPLRLTQTDFDALVEFLRGASSWSEFASSLWGQVQQGRPLTEKQTRAALSMKEKVEAKRAAKASSYQTSPESYPRIAATLGYAGESLKYPKLRLVTESGQRVVLVLGGKGHINVTDGRPFGENTYFGRIMLDGPARLTQAVTPEIRALLAEVEADPASAARAQGVRTGACCFCSRELTDERSTEKGYGPICATKWGLPWG